MTNSRNTHTLWRAGSQHLFICARAIMLPTVLSLDSNLMRKLKLKPSNLQICQPTGSMHLNASRCQVSDQQWLKQKTRWTIFILRVTDNTWSLSVWGYRTTWQRFTIQDLVLWLGNKTGKHDEQNHSHYLRFRCFCNEIRTLAKAFASQL